jgi:uncharacterized protein YacL
MATNRSNRVRHARTISRIVGAILGFILGLLYGGFVLSGNPGLTGRDTQVTQAELIGLACAGSAFLATAAPLLSVDPYLWLIRFLDEAPALEVVGATAGALVGLVLAACLAILLSGVPLGFGYVISLALACVLVSVGVRVGRRRREAFADLVLPGTGDRDPLPQPIIVLDTSVLVDGRVVDIARSGFIFGEIVVAGFVLEELQRLADSGDSARREKGRRGLKFVDDLKELPYIRMEISDQSLSAMTDVDAGLVKLSHDLNAHLMTNDFNLNRLARVEGIPVLNINELSNAVKPIARNGDVLQIQITKRGKEPHQGVGYLEDGTMVVVERADGFIDRTMSVVVNSVLQTAAGRMVFASPEGDTGEVRHRRTGS